MSALITVVKYRLADGTEGETKVRRRMSDDMAVAFVSERLRNEHGPGGYCINATALREEENA